MKNNKKTNSKNEVAVANTVSTPSENKIESVKSAPVVSAEDQAEIIAKFKANADQLFRAVVNKRLGLEEYDNKKVTKELRTEIGALTFVEKCAELGLTVKAGTTTKTPAKEKAPKAEKAPVVTEDVTKVPVGSVIRYASSNKPYIVTAEVEGGRRIFSKKEKVQTFAATKPFPVVVIEKGTGKLPVSFKDEALNTLLAAATEDLNAREAAIKAAADKKAAREAEKAAKKQAEVKTEAPVAEAAKA